MAATLKIYGLTLRVSTNVREKTTKILAYRKGGFKRAYRATLPMCVGDRCHLDRPHITTTSHLGYADRTFYHQSDVDNLVKKLIKSYI